MRDEPGISVGNNTGAGSQVGRTGSTGFVIRGIGENRVRQEIHGVKVPDYPQTNFGSPTGYTRDFIDYDSPNASRSSVARRRRFTASP